MKRVYSSDLRGSVRLCQLQRTSFIRQCGVEACDVEERRFSTKVEELSEDGRLLAIQKDGQTVSQTVYECDELARQARIVVRTADAEERVSETSEYDSEGRTKKIFLVDMASQKPNTGFLMRSGRKRYLLRGAGCGRDDHDLQRA